MGHESLDSPGLRIDALGSLHKIDPNKADQRGQREYAAPEPGSVTVVRNYVKHEKQVGLQKDIWRMNELYSLKRSSGNSADEMNSFYKKVIRKLNYFGEMSAPGPV